MMKNLLKIIFGLILTTSAFADISEQDKSKIRGGGIQLLVNPGFESGKGDWTMSGSGAFAIATSGSNLLAGKGSATFDAAAASDYIQSSLYTLPNGLYGRNCYVEMLQLGGDTNYSLQVLDGSSNVLGSTALVATTLPTKVYFNFICPTSGSIRVRLTSSANAAIVAVDNFVLGEAINIANISQSKVLVAARRSGSDQNIASTSETTVIYNSESVDTFGEYNTTTGIYTANATRRLYFGLQFSLNNIAASDGWVARIRKNGSTTQCDAFFTTPSGTGVNQVFTMNQCVIDVVAGDTLTVSIDSGSDASYDVQNSLASFLTILEFPTTQEMAIRPDLQFWKVDANISGANPSLGTGSQASYINISDASLTLTNNSGQGNIAAQIPCSSTNAPTGTTCSVGSEQIGVAFTPTGTFPQEVLACASFTWKGTVSAASSSVIPAFQIVETPTNAQTISQEGKTRITARTVTDAVTALTQEIPLRVCGNFTFSSGGQKALRLAYEQLSAGTVSESLVLADANASLGQRDIHWEVYPINQGIPAPLLVGSVNSNSTGMERIEYARLTCSGSASIASQSGSWVSSIANVASGDCALTLNSSIFSAIPTCVVSPTDSGPNYHVGINYTSPTSISVTCKLTDGTTDCTSYTASLMCMGPR